MCCWASLVEVGCSGEYLVIDGNKVNDRWVPSTSELCNGKNSFICSTFIRIDFLHNFLHIPIAFLAYLHNYARIRVFV
jgi:hypothetical protein